MKLLKQSSRWQCQSTEAADATWQSTSARSHPAYLNITKLLKQAGRCQCRSREAAEATWQSTSAHSHPAYLNITKLLKQAGRCQFWSCAEVIYNFSSWTDVVSSFLDWIPIRIGVFMIKNCHLLIPRPPSYRRILQPNIQPFNTWKFWTFLYFCGSFLPSCIRIRIPNPDPDLRTRSGSTDLIRIRNTVY